MKTNTQYIKTYGMYENSALGKIYSCKHLFKKKIRKNANQ